MRKQCNYGSRDWSNVAKSHRMSEATRSLKGKRMASPLKSPWGIDLVDTLIEAV